ncbi:hypothetical protein LTR37_014911 [Vermiconidia calcicola]|uniref:Uncharacterized protein n=1 Tax=Vermiconidia calcicola TaxID=1690605 RepID=A0ACC3MTS4_9PEZI|nr:hypothetical protein LTR37_014911 [Vermiconidia calcicola]
MATESTEPLKRMPESSGTPDLRGAPSIVGMSEWLNMLGHSENEINSLNVIHIAGTKGKGSTCAFTESFLRAHGQPTGFPRKTGMYTSPHLLVPEERIRINSKPLEPELFAKYFFEVYDRLPQLARDYDPVGAVVERGPRYLQLFALFAFHVFIREQVDLAILETHNGGEYDATNVVEKPVVTAITTLGMDHVDQLGPSIQNIAWHKSGIYKRGAVALSTLQDLNPAKVLQDRAEAAGEQVRFISDDEKLPANALQLKVAVQRKNASLGTAAAQAFLDRRAPAESRTLTKEDLHLGVQQWNWPGRFQIIADAQRTWFLDAAHNELSVVIAAKWFAEAGAELDGSAAKILVFSHISESRDTTGLLRSLACGLKQNGVNISHVIFTTYDESESSKSFTTLDKATAFRETWTGAFPNTKIWDEPTIQGAIVRAQSIECSDATASVQTLITGSQHLVGPALRILQHGKHTTP